MACYLGGTHENELRLIPLDLSGSGNTHGEVGSLRMRAETNEHAVCRNIRQCIFSALSS